MRLGGGVAWNFPLSQRRLLSLIFITTRRRYATMELGLSTAHQELANIEEANQITKK